ncbi:ABC transporter substrate-binding protein [Oerskovia flava]|uniref:ABC transporter substrate-binding protein n=1 Tax=Oerskovia flava TaxID=2986422 RepID=UPI00223F2A44|nr:extracellular solute-binding protein [Oerskovia sp. JB1-3-2]
MARRMTTAAVGAAGIAALALGACTPAESTTGEPSADAATIDSATCTPEEGPLRIYLNPWGELLSDTFTQEAGIETEIADIGGGEILARIAAEANNPQWDVVVLDGHGSLQALADEGRLRTGWTSLGRDNLDEAGAGIAPDDNAWLPLSQHAAAVIAYNTAAVTDPPSTWAELAEPGPGPLGMADPAVAAPAYPIVSWFYEDLGTDGAQEYFDALGDRGLNTYPKNGPVGQALASGEIEIALLQEQNVYGLLEAGESVDFVWPDEGAPAVVRGVAISADTPRPCAAQQLVDWLLTPETMGTLMADGGDDGIITPFVTGTDTSSLPDARPDDGVLLVTDGRFAADNEVDIKDWFANRSAG